MPVAVPFEELVYRVSGADGRNEDAGQGRGGEAHQNGKSSHSGRLRTQCGRAEVTAAPRS